MRPNLVICWACCLILLQGIGLVASAQQSSRRALVTHVDPLPLQVSPDDDAGIAPLVEELPRAPQPWLEIAPTLDAGLPAANHAVIDAELVPLPADLVERALLAANTELDRPYQNHPSLGTDRVPFALFELDPARPQNNVRLRYDGGYGVNKPSRSLYFGPGTLTGNLDYRDYRFYREVSTGRASGFMEYGLRDLRPGATALTDMQVGAKAILLDGSDLFLLPTPRNADDGFVLSSIFRSHIPLGPALEKKGTSTGHFSLEPGLLANYQFSPFTHLHGQATLWIPIGADKVLAGEVFKWGVGVSRMLYSGPIDFAWCENAALISSLEVVGWEFLSGEGANDASVIVIEPGLRAVLGNRFELGLSSAVAPTNNRISRKLLRFEMRWFW